MTTTPSQTVGPYYSIGLCRRPDDELAADGVELAGRLLDGQGEPIRDGVIEVFDQASRTWGRSGTDAEGRFRFRVPREARRLEAFVFSRGLLRHQLTRIYLDGGAEAEDETLVAAAEGGGFRFDIRMQGERATLFFEH
jgi:protocatechuate 3,4-dioxygenase, alpha subunit